MVGFTLKHFRYFDALARSGHFGRAAEACSISQPALSVQIKEIEKMLGAPLVERSARHFRLTALGEEFLQRARNILAAVEEMSELARTSDGPLQGNLRLGIIPTVAPYLLPKVMQSLSGAFPSLEVLPRETVTQALVEDLLHGRLDVVIAALPVDGSGLSQFDLFEEEFVLVRPIHDIDRPLPSPSMLKEMRLLLLEEGHCFRDQALSFCDMGTINPNLVMEGSSLSTLVQMVGANLGVTLLPEIAIDLETRHTDVWISRFKDDKPTRKIGMLWRKNNPLARQFISLGSVIRTAVEADFPETARERT